MLQNACQTGREIEGIMSRKVLVFSNEETMRRQKSNSRIHIVCSLQTHPLQTRTQLSFKTWMQEGQISKAYLRCCLCADWYAREAAADTCDVMKIKHWVHVWTTLSNTHRIWWILQCRCPPLSQAPQAKLLIFILQVITGDMFKYAEIFN